MQETQVRSLCLEDPLEKKMATHSSPLAWKISWTEEPGRLHLVGYSPWGRKEVDTTERLHLTEPGKLWGHYILVVSLFPLFKPTEEQESLDGICISNSILDIYMFSDHSITFSYWGNIAWVPPPCRHRHVLTQIFKFLPVPAITWEMKMINLALQMWSRKVK